MEQFAERISEEPQNLLSNESDTPERILQNRSRYNSKETEYQIKWAGKSERTWVSGKELDERWPDLISSYKMHLKSKRILENYGEETSGEENKKRKVLEGNEAMDRPAKVLVVPQITEILGMRRESGALFYYCRQDNQEKPLWMHKYAVYKQAAQLVFQFFEKHVKEKPAKETQAESTNPLAKPVVEIINLADTPPAPSLDFTPDETERVPVTLENERTAPDPNELTATPKLSKEARSELLEPHYQTNPTPSKEEKREIARLEGLTTVEVAHWFRWRHVREAETPDTDTPTTVNTTPVKSLSQRRIRTPSS